MKTVILVLKSFGTRAKFEEAVEWIKGEPEETRFYFRDRKVWVYDLGVSSVDPGFFEACQKVRSQGWAIIGETLWDGRPIRKNEEILAPIIFNVCNRFDTASPFREKANIT